MIAEINRVINMSKKQLSPLEMEWVEATQEFLRENLDKSKPSIKTNFTGEEVREINKWLFRVTSKTMDQCVPMEQCGRIVLTEFYPDKEWDKRGADTDPVLPIPLIDDLVGNSKFVQAFRNMYRIQQRFVMMQGPDSDYGKNMIRSVKLMQDSGIDELLTNDERNYFWDMILDVLAHPFEYLNVEKQSGWKRWQLILLFVVIAVGSFGISFLLF